MSPHGTDRTPPFSELAAVLARSRARRAALLADPSVEALRLLHPWGEDLDGLAIDRYGPLLLASAYDAAWGSEEGRAALRAAFPGEPLFLRYRGRGAGPAEQIGGPGHEGRAWVHEAGLRFEVDVCRGANPGLFLDTRPLRRWLREEAAGRRVLNLFAYTCSLGVAAAAGGASGTTNVDTSPAVLSRGRSCYDANALDRRSVDFLKGDARKRLDWLRARGRSYDLVVADPPSFSSRRRGGFDSSRQYAGLARRCLAVAAPGGRLVFTRNASTRGAEQLAAELSPGLPGCRLEQQLTAGPDFVPERAPGLTVLIYRVPAEGLSQSRSGSSS